MAESAKDKSCYQPGVGYIPPTVPLSAKEVAERLAGPHGERCTRVNLQSGAEVFPCDCSRRERVAAIEAAIREAVRERDGEWLEAIWPGNHTTALGEEILRGGPSFAAAVREHDRDLQAADLAEARRLGREEMREEAAKAIHDFWQAGSAGGDPRMFNAAAAAEALVAALPLEGPGPGG